MTEMNVIALCAGGGGLEVGLKAGLMKFGIKPRVVCWVERDPGARAVLLTRMDKGEIDRAPLWDDLTLPLEDWSVDIVTAGYPCQPFSTQGKRRATADERWLWDDVWRVVRGTGARIAFFENVAAHLYKGKGFGTVLRDMASSGWVAEWDCIPAAAVGSPQRRDRVFIAATSDPEWLRETVSDTFETGRIKSTHYTGQTGKFWLEHVSPGWVRASPGSSEEDSRVRSAVHGSWEAHPPPPYICSLDDGVDPQVIRTALQVLGNGVVPQAAERAVEVLLPRLMA